MKASKSESLSKSLVSVQFLNCYSCCTVHHYHTLHWFQFVKVVKFNHHWRHLIFQITISLS